jgi:hypothetical protein
MAKMQKHDDEAQDKKLFNKLIKKEEKKLGVKKMAKGGVTSSAMKSVGRNMARANNQRGG